MLLAFNVTGLIKFNDRRDYKVLRSLKKVTYYDDCEGFKCLLKSDLK